MSRKPYKSKKRGVGQFVQLHQWFMATEAWATLKPGPRALYVELKRRFNGANNGDIFLSHREAAKAINVNRNTITAYFAELQERGFIEMTQGPHLGPAGIGQASKWFLEEEPTPDGKAARKAFMAWREKQNPRPKNRTPRPKKRDGPCHQDPKEGGSVLFFGTLSGDSSRKAS